MNTATNTAQDLSFAMKMHILKHDGFKRRELKAHVPLLIHTTQYTVKTVDSYEEYMQVMRLRHLVFQKEFAQKRFCMRSDRDKYDNHADFIVVRDNRSGMIVGSYRLLCSKFTSDFYSASEFHIDELIASPGIKLELSRACILRDHRNGRVLNLLWRGIASYMDLVNARYFFGCGSVQTMDSQELRLMEQSFITSGIRCNRFNIPVQKKYKMQAGSIDPNAEPKEFEVPGLLRAYFKAGARICSEPAIDRKFKCADFLVVLDTQELEQSYRERYVPA